jgi:hypothetical protein
MADKKVDRHRRERSLTPTQKMKAAMSDPGTVNMAEPTHDKGKSALVDKFRKREERWRREQSLHDQEISQAAEADERLEADSKNPPQGAERGEGGGR